MTKTRAEEIFGNLISQKFVTRHDVYVAAGKIESTMPEDELVTLVFDEGKSGELVLEVAGQKEHFKIWEASR